MGAGFWRLRCNTQSVRSVSLTSVPPLPKPLAPCPAFHSEHRSTCFSASLRSMWPSFRVNCTTIQQLRKRRERRREEVEWGVLSIFLAPHGSVSQATREFLRYDFFEKTLEPLAQKKIPPGVCLHSLHSEGDPSYRNNLWVLRLLVGLRNLCD